VAGLEAWRRQLLDDLWLLEQFVATACRE